MVLAPVGLPCSLGVNHLKRKRLLVTAKFDKRSKLAHELDFYVTFALTLSRWRDWQAIASYCLLFAWVMGVFNYNEC